MHTSHSNYFFDDGLEIYVPPDPERSGTKRRDRVPFLHRKWRSEREAVADDPKKVRHAQAEALLSEAQTCIRVGFEPPALLTPQYWARAQMRLALIAQ